MITITARLSHFHWSEYRRPSLPLKYINDLETKRSYKRKVNLKNFKCFKKSIERFENYSLICKRRLKVYKTAQKNASIHTYQTLLSSNQLELSPWSFTHVFKKIETTMRWNCMSKALRLLQITAKHQDSPFFTVSNYKNFIPKYLYNALTELWEEKAPLNDFGRTVPSAEIYCCK